jgi:hypothetical protein
MVSSLVVKRSFIVVYMKSSIEATMDNPALKTLHSAARQLKRRSGLLKKACFFFFAAILPVCLQDFEAL